MCTFAWNIPLILNSIAALFTCLDLCMCLRFSANQTGSKNSRFGILAGRSWVPYPVTESDNQSLECWQGLAYSPWSRCVEWKKIPNLCYQHVSQWMSEIITAIIQYHTERHSTHTVCWIQCTWPHFTLTAFTHTFSQHGNPVMSLVVFLSRMFDFFHLHGCHNKCCKPSQQKMSINCSVSCYMSHCIWHMQDRKTVSGWIQWLTSFPVRCQNRVDMVLPNINVIMCAKYWHSLSVFIKEGKTVMCLF